MILVSLRRSTCFFLNQNHFRYEDTDLSKCTKVYVAVSFSKRNYLFLFFKIYTDGVWSIHFCIHTNQLLNISCHLSFEIEAQALSQLLSNSSSVANFCPFNLFFIKGKSPKSHDSRSGL